MPICFLVILAVVVFASSTCARRVPEPRGVAPGTPYISWVLMYGDRDNADREFSCQSDRKGECVLPATRHEQVFSDIHFYYHGAGAETKYEGTKTIGYLQGAPASTRSSITVKKNESLTNESATGIVTATPGTYTVALSFTATVTSTGKTQPLQHSIAVVVK